MSREVLSAAVDNAATEAEWDRLLAALDDDLELKAEWSRLWAVRDVREGVSLGRAGEDFCAGVMSAVQREGLPSGKVVDLAGRRPRRALPTLSWRSLVPLSAAAGMAAAVLFFGQPFSNPASPETVAVVAPAPGDDQGQPLTAASAEALNDYLMEHSNTLAERSMGGAISNARFVVNTAAYTPDGQ